ncbi:MAG TPA: sugar kinase [Clostridiaceae bacterium]|nr:sugar kinase [Clostridiaceae bacterium]
MKLKENCKYNLVIPTSMGLRLTPVDRMPVHMSNQYLMTSTSAESNVGQISASLGKKVKLLTAFVEDNAISDFIKGELRKRNIDFEGPDVPTGGPWGYRHHINIADSGYGMRGPHVLNDRAGEVGRSLNAKYFDLDRIFKEEGAQIIHISGLIAALSADTSEFCLEVARAAKANGTKIAFDLNHRASFWVGREEELRAAFDEIAGYADILIGNEEDYQLALGIKGPEAGGVDIADKIDGFKEMVKRVHEAYPNCQVFANTLRDVKSANEHEWGAILYVNDNFYVVEPRPIPVLDRIGGGDGFVGGLLYSILSGWDEDKWVKFAWATGALASTLLTDYACPANEEQVWAIYEGNARVKR